MVKITLGPFHCLKSTIQSFREFDPVLHREAPSHPVLTWMGSGPSRLGAPSQGSFMDMWAPFGSSLKEHEAEVLTAHLKTPRPVYGWEVDIEAPKSLSILWGLASPPIREKLLAAHQRSVEETLRQIEHQAVREKDTDHYGAFFATKARRLDDQGNPCLREQCLLLGVQHGDCLDHGLLRPSELALSESHAELCYNLAMTSEMDRQFGWLRLERTRAGLEIAGVPEKLHNEFSQEPSLESFRGYDQKKEPLRTEGGGLL